MASWPKEVGTGRSPVRASLVAAVGLLCVSTPASADGIRLDVCPMASEGQSCSNAIPGSRPDTPGPVSIPGTPPPATVPGTCVQGKCERYGLISAGGNGGGAGAGGASGGGGASGASGAGGATFGPILYDCLRRVWRLPAGRSDLKFVLHGAVAVVVAIMIAGIFEYNLGDSEVLTMFLVVVGCAYAAMETAAPKEAATVA